MWTRLCVTLGPESRAEHAPRGHRRGLSWTWARKSCLGSMARRLQKHVRGGHRTMRTVFAALLAAALAPVVPAAQSNMAKPEKYTAFAVDMSNTAPRNNTTPLDVTINRWTTDQERATLREALSKGQDALLKALQKLPAVGYINT